MTDLSAMIYAEPSTGYVRTNDQSSGIPCSPGYVMTGSNGGDQSIYFMSITVGPPLGMTGQLTHANPSTSTSVQLDINSWSFSGNHFLYDYHLGFCSVVKHWCTASLLSCLLGLLQGTNQLLSHIHKANPSSSTFLQSTGM